MKIFDKEIKKAIKDTIRIDESLVAQQKRFDIQTDFLSDSNIGNHIDLYEAYIQDFNLISAKLDSVDRKEVSSNDSLFKNLKHDETYNLNAAYLHELYFANIGDPNSQITMDSLSLKSASICSAPTREAEQFSFGSKTITFEMCSGIFLAASVSIIPS